MTRPLRVVLFQAERVVWSGPLPDALELGRQEVSSGPAEPPPYALLEREGDTPRLIIAEKNERAISRRHLRLVVEPEGRIRVVNLSKNQPVRSDLGDTIRPGAEVVLSTARPLLLQIGDRVLRLETEPDDSEAGLQSLSRRSMVPGHSLLMGRDLRTSVALKTLNQASPDRVMSWLGEMIDVLHSAASSPRFLEDAAQAVVQIVGLDSGQVLLRSGNDWRRCAQWTADRASTEAPAPSNALLGRVLEQRKTVWQTPDSPSSESLMGVNTVIAAPILDAQGTVIGAIYGDRRVGDSGAAISNLEARMVDVLAYAVASGLARQRQEEEAVAARLAAAEERTKLGQFFSPMLAEQLREHPELLDGRDVDVSVLFCDIRGFTRVSERLEPRQMTGWINDSLGALSECVIDHGGVLVDYVGDELMAMWGAPVDQPDHARRACRAASDMLRRLPGLDEKWRGLIETEMQVGIGISSGPARVGNTGSARKFKYGPVGRTVNLGSRVQGATKWLRVPALITETTARDLGGEFPVRRLCRVRVVNLEQPVTLYQLALDAGETWESLRGEYEAALEAFERQDFHITTQLLGGLLRDHPGDGPSLLLLSRAVEAMQGRGPFDDVWTLPAK